MLKQTSADVVSLKPKTKKKPHVAILKAEADVPLEIIRYTHCAQCIAEKPADKSPEKWARLSVGITAKGMQIWCYRHNCNVALLEWA